MRHKVVVFMAMLLSFVLMAGCSNKGPAAGSNGAAYVDGVYNAEFAEFDSNGYKDTLKVEVKNGVVESMLYDAVNKEGGLKTQNEAYRKEMEAMQDTYPAKVAADLVNQYLEHQDINKVNMVAGATYSSESFIALYKALAANMQKGDTSLVVVENTPER